MKEKVPQMRKKGKTFDSKFKCKLFKDLEDFNAGKFGLSFDIQRN